MRSLAGCVAMLALLGACDAPSKEAANAPTAAIPDEDPNPFRADALGDRPYAGDWATAMNQCADEKKLWTVEPLRMGVQRKRFCVFEKIFVAENTGNGEVWSASARCVAEGRQTQEFVFFRVKPSRQEMRVTVNDNDAVDLVRCPSRT